MLSDVPQLLVSVRSAAEAEAALAGGADVIDVKDPTRGALGRADDDVLEAVRRTVADARPISAALGELADFTGEIPTAFDYVKCGLAGSARDPDWPRRLTNLMEAARTAVVVAYADWQCALAPPAEEVVAFACRRPGSILLIDTCCKDKTFLGHRATLLDWLPLAMIDEIVKNVHQAQGRVALAGSLSLDNISALRHINPDWIAVRGAACEGSDRDAAIDADRVRRIKSLLRSVPVDPGTKRPL